MTALVAGPLSVIAALLALSAVLRDQAPNLIPSFWPDPLAPLASWSREVASNPIRISDRRTRDVALTALRVQPLTPSAFRMLALWEDAHQHGRAAAAMADLSQRLSRRDLLTQLLQIQYAVAQRDVKGALGHYDIALRTSPESQKILFPVLTAAIADPPVRDALTPYVRENAPWIGGFLFNATDVQGGTISVAKLLLHAGPHNSNVLEQGLTSKLLTKLADLHELDLAESLFITLPGADRAMLSDTSFDARTTDPRFGVLGWFPVNGPSISSVFDWTNANGRQLHVVVEGAIGRQVALRRLFKFRPGRYRFHEWRTTDETMGSASWRISCLGSVDGSTVSSATEPRAAPDKPHDLEFAATCQWQEVELTVSPNGNGTLVLTVDRVLLRPLADVTQRIKRATTQ